MGPPAAWWQQLAVGGRLVVPLVLHGSGLTRAIGFEHRQPGRLDSTSAQVCGFVPMRGAAEHAEHAERSLGLADEVVLYLDPGDLGDDAALSRALTHRAYEHWTGIYVHDDDPVAHLDLWLATTTGNFARLVVGSQARQSGLAVPALRWAGAALFEGGTLAYLAVRPLSEELVELGVTVHGPDSRKLAAHTNDLLHQWDQVLPAEPVITAHRTDTPEGDLPPGVRITRPETVLTVSW